jgi:hypothetical protein
MPALRSGPIAALRHALYVTGNEAKVSVSSDPSSSLDRGIQAAAPSSSLGSPLFFRNIVPAWIGSADGLPGEQSALRMLQCGIAAGRLHAATANGHYPDSRVFQKDQNR